MSKQWEVCLHNGELSLVHVDQDTNSIKALGIRNLRNREKRDMKVCSYKMKITYTGIYAIRQAIREEFSPGKSTAISNTMLNGQLQMYIQQLYSLSKLYFSRYTHTHKFIQGAMNKEQGKAYR